MIGAIAGILVVFSVFFFDKKFFAHRRRYEYRRYCIGHSNRQSLHPVFKLPGRAPSDASIRSNRMKLLKNDRVPIA